TQGKLIAFDPQRLFPPIDFFTRWLHCSCVEVKATKGNIIVSPYVPVIVCIPSRVIVLLVWLDYIVITISSYFYSVLAEIELWYLLSANIVSRFGFLPRWILNWLPVFIGLFWIFIFGNHKQLI